jgi:hypothetical protein
MRIGRISTWKLYFWAIVFSGFLGLSFLSFFWLTASEAQTDKLLADYNLEAYQNLVIYFFAIPAVSFFCIAFWGTCRFLKNWRHSSNLSNFLLRVTALPDEEATELLEVLGLRVSIDTINLDPKYFKYASADALSHAVTFLLYLEGRDSLNSWLSGEHSVFHSLADLLLDTVSDQYIADFIGVMKDEKVYLGELLEAALTRRELEHEAKLLNDQIDQVVEQERAILNKSVSAIGANMEKLKGLIPEVLNPNVQEA